MPVKSCLHSHCTGSNSFCSLPTTRNFRLTGGDAGHLVKWCHDRRVFWIASHRHRDREDCGRLDWRLHQLPRSDSLRLLRDIGVGMHSHAFAKLRVVPTLKKHACCPKAAATLPARTGASQTASFGVLFLGLLASRLLQCHPLKLPRSTLIDRCALLSPMSVAPLDCCLGVFVMCEWPTAGPLQECLCAVTKTIEACSWTDAPICVDHKSAVLDLHSLKQDPCMLGHAVLRCGPVQQSASQSHSSATQPTVLSLPGWFCWAAP